MLCSTVCYFEEGEIGKGEFIFVDGISGAIDEEGLHVIKAGRKVNTTTWRANRTEWGVFFEDDTSYYFTGVPDAALLSLNANNLIEFTKSTDKFSQFVIKSIIARGRTAPQDFEIAPKILQAGEKPIYLVENWIIRPDNKDQYIVLPKDYVVDEAYSATVQDLIKWLKTGKMPDLKKRSAFWCPGCAFYAETFYPVPEFSEKPKFIKWKKVEGYTYKLSYGDFECKVDSWYMTVECKVKDRKVSVYGEVTLSSDEPVEWLQKIVDASSYVRVDGLTARPTRNSPLGTVGAIGGKVIVESNTPNYALGNPCGIGSNYIGEFMDKKNDIEVRGIKIPTSRGTVLFPDIVNGHVVVSLNGEPITTYGTAEKIKRISFVSSNTVLPELCHIARSIDEILPEALRGVLTIETKGEKRTINFSLEDDEELRLLLNFGSF